MTTGSLFKSFERHIFSVYPIVLTVTAAMLSACNSVSFLEAPYKASIEVTPYAPLSLPLQKQKNIESNYIEHSIDGSRKVKPANSSLNSQQKYYQNLTREVAFKHANHDGLDAAGLQPQEFASLFTALIEQESGFNPKAVSLRGARGLGQLMPQTARELGVKDSFKPRQNLKGAATYFADMLRKFKSVDLALAAYNAGPGRVARYGGIPPYKETQNYVAKIAAASNLRPARKHFDIVEFTPLTNDTTLKGNQSVWEF